VVLSVIIVVKLSMALLEDEVYNRFYSDRELCVFSFCTHVRTAVMSMLFNIILYFVKFTLSAVVFPGRPNIVR
jgi:hypothetical protein